MGTPLSQSIAALMPSMANDLEVAFDETKVVFVSSRVLSGTGVARCGGSRCFGEVKDVRKSPGLNASNVNMKSPELDCK
jgi:hypothetical protein